MIKYLMKVFYANESYAKYGVSQGKYFMALLSMSIYIIMTLLFLAVVVFAISPSVYKAYLSASTKLNSLVCACIILFIVFFVLRLTIPEESLANNQISKEEATKTINYLLVYGISLAIALGIIAVKFLKIAKH